MADLSVRLVRLPLEAMRALEAGDLQTANDSAGVTLSEFLAGEECRWIWPIFSNKVEADPAYADWVVRAAIDEQTGLAVGHAGFHAPPDGEGMVEVGCTVDPDNAASLASIRGFGFEQVGEQ